MSDTNVSIKLKLPKASYIGNPHLYLDSIDSTNNYAMNLLSKCKPIEGTAITAGFQSVGRGQIGRTWWGDAFKNLYTSIILSPRHIKSAEQWTINQAISLSIAECLESWIKLPVSIKWPNDIYIRDKKVCGILIQCVLSGKTIQHAVVGIGLNINQESFPNTIPNPTSLYMESGKKLPIIGIRNSLYAFIEKWYESTMTPNAGALQSKYLSRLYRRGESNAFMKGGSMIYGEINGVDKIGRLILSINGKEEIFNFNEVKMIINKQIL